MKCTYDVPGANVIYRLLNDATMPNTPVIR